MFTTSIAKRYCGPPQSGNGGYSCGLLGKQINGASRVRLHLPPPLETPLTIESLKDSWQLRRGDELIGTAVAAKLEMVPPQPPSLEQARRARDNYKGFGEHSFPQCFVCGTGRHQGDGLRLFTGNINGQNMVACDWEPTADLVDGKGQVKTEFIWSALDCPSYFALNVPVDPEAVCLLGEMTASIDKPVPGDQPLIVYAWKRSIEGRKHYSAAALCTAQGEVLARAEHLWIRLNKEAL
ncbi:hypothetical protein N8087_03105 [Porticoccaceae bacterium]|nr:hypothetical protein [Porticoccaceae bacterium]